MSKKKVRSKGIAKNKESHDNLEQKSSSTSQHHDLRVLIFLFLIIAILVTYEPVRNNEFINYDDDVYVTENLNVQTGLALKSVFWAFRTGEATNWHPLTWVSHLLDYEIYGLKASGHHLTNLLLHIINTILLFLIINRITGTLWESGFIAALFALHPLNVESVAWVAERKNVLSTFFLMLTIWAYIAYVKRPKLSRYLLIVFSFILGLLSKPMLVTLPFVMLLLDYWPLERFQFGHLMGPDKLSVNKTVNSRYQKTSILYLILEKVPLFALSIGSSFLTILAAQNGGAIASLEVYPLGMRISNILVSYVSYICKMLWPHKLAVLYPYPEIIPLWQVVGACLFLLCISFLVIQAAQRRPYLLMGWLWYLGTLVPVIGLVQVGVQSMANRYAYVPLIGLFIIITMGVTDLLARWRHGRAIFVITASLFLFSLIILTRNQVYFWRNSITLFEHTLKVTVNNSRIHNSLGFTLVRQGEIQEAINHYTEALRIEPSYSVAHYNLGIALTMEGNIEDAIAHYTRALQINPNYAIAHNKLGILLTRKGKHQEAITHFSEALRVKPDSVELYINLGNSLVAMGRIGESIAYYTEALRINDYHFGAHYNLGNALFRQGKIQEAITHYGRSLQIKPDFAEAHFNLGLASFMIGDRKSAIQQYQILKTINPDLADRLSREIIK
jgi:tetratricopeptide (TPR) repeat protein